MHAERRAQLLLIPDCLCGLQDEVPLVGKQEEDQQKTHLVATAAAKATAALSRAKPALSVAAAGRPVAKAPGGPVAPVAPLRPEWETTTCQAQLLSQEK